MRLYLVHDKEYAYMVVIKASRSNDAIEKLHKWFEKAKQHGEFFNSNNVKWIADLCDNDVVIE